MSPEVRRGEVWFADVAGDKRRPVLVLTRDPMGAILNSVICAPVTTKIRSLSVEVPIGEGAGLPRPSVANLDNTMLIQRSRFVRRVGQVPPATMRAACAALAIATGCR